MNLVPEYDTEDPQTWYPIAEPSVDSSFDKELIRIAGLNPFGQPMLQKRWAVSYIDPMAETDEPKYLYVVKNPTLIGFEFTDEGGTRFVKRLEDVPPHVLIPVPKYNNPKLGERRWVIEVWRSAEFLARSDRYRQTHDTGDSEIRISCRNCGGQMRRTGNEDERVCIVCGSKRQSIVETREIKNERLLRDLPAEGCYDYFLRLETADGFYRPADAGSLNIIRLVWAHTQKSQQEKNRLYLKQKEAEAQQALASKRERHDYIWSDDFKEEKYVSSSN